MTVTVTFAEHGLHVRLSGRFDRAALDDMTRAAWHHARWDDARYVVVDLLGITQVELSETDVQLQAALANAGSLSTRKSRTATVASHPVVRHLTLLFQARTRSDLFEARLFDDIDSATAWARAAGPRGIHRVCA